MKKLSKRNVTVKVEAYKKPNSSKCTTCAGGCWSGSSVLLTAVRSRIKS